MYTLAYTHLCVYTQYTLIFIYTIHTLIYVFIHTRDRQNIKTSRIKCMNTLAFTYTHLCIYTIHTLMYIYIFKTSKYFAEVIGNRMYECAYFYIHTHTDINVQYTHLNIYIHTEDRQVFCRRCR